jgi:dihydrofolate reductase
MTRVRLDHAISLDGFTAGPDQSLQEPLGVGGEHLHDWMFGADVHPNDQRIKEEHFAGVGAYVMGRNMFGGGRGPWNLDEPWTGWWGEDPPFHKPVFVVTHHAREAVEMEGGTTFRFVTDGPAAALELAKAAAGGDDVRVAGGADIANQLFAIGAIDELQLHYAPILLGGGERLFVGVAPDALTPAIDRVVASPTVTHVRYRFS